MAKTRRKKINQSPRHPYGGRRARAKVFVIAKGEPIVTKGVRGRTIVHRIVNDEGRQTVRVVEAKPQIAAKAVGDRKPKIVYVGRAYTGVGRSKAYPYRSTKRGGAPLKVNRGLIARAAKAMKQVIVRDDA